MLILGIESSCDETGASVVENGTQILSNIISSSAAMHEKYGGIIPEIAARAQAEVIIPTINEALSQANISPQDLDGIAVVYAPGLLGSLLVGVETAKSLALTWNKPIMKVNHLIGHIYANWLTDEEKPEFPAIGVIVSGSHSDLLYIEGHGKIKWLGGTRDDAAGESFDKVARLIGLPYPGGPAIDKLAPSGDKDAIKFSRPMINSGDYDFSFSGIKTEAARYREKINTDDKDKQADFAASFQEAIVDVIVTKAVKAAQEYKVKSILAGGGVAANTRLKKELQTRGTDAGFKVFVPPPSLSTDNGAVMASYAYFNWNAQDPLTIEADPTPDFE